MHHSPTFFGFRLHKGPKAKLPPYLADVFLILLTLSLLYGFVLYTRQFFGAYQERVEIDLSLKRLPLYTFFSMARGLCAYVCALIFSLVWGFWAAKDRMAEKILIPLLDILQSIPFLGFLPGMVLFLVGLFQKSNIGLELAAIGLIFTAQAWNMAFGVYHAIRTIPEEIKECATAYGLRGWQRFRKIELPATTLSLVWNSIVSMAAGWFFLMVNEAYKLGDRDFQLPGLGSYMSVAVAQGNGTAILGAIGAMIVLIVFLDQILWRPLVVWSQKFRIEETASPAITETWFSLVLKNSVLLSAVRKGCKRITRAFEGLKRKGSGLAPLLLSRGCLLLLLGLLITALSFVIQSVSDVSMGQWLLLFKSLLFTFARVIVCLIVALLIAVPLGLMIGLSEKGSSMLEPFIQIGASFPATLLFPIVVLVFHFLRIPLGIGSIVLMGMGSFWYIFLNVIAGAKAMPSDLKEVADHFTLSRKQRFFWLHLPSIFPYLITGLVAASGGAWNTSIVAEYVSYKGQILTTEGIGSSISLAAQNNDMQLLAASVLVLVVVVVAINLGVWLRLYRYSEKRFTINA